MNCKRCHKDMMVDALYCPWCGAKQELTRGKKTRGNGQGSIYKEGSTYTAQIVIGWRYNPTTQKRIPVKRVSKGHKTKIKADEALRRLQSSSADIKICPNLSSYWDLYSSQELPKLSKSKQTAYRIAWDKVSLLHFQKVDSITVADLRSIAEQAAPTYYPRRDIKSLMGHLFELAGADGFASKDLPDYIQLPKLEEKEREAFSDAEQKSLWQSYESGSKDARIPLVMIYTGMMPGEIIKLKAEMIDFDQKIITDLGIKTEIRKKSAVYIPDCLIPILQELCDESKNGKLFAINKDNLYNRYYAALETAGVRRLTPYSCRHTTATALAITENIAPQTIKKIMRWSTTRMLDRYAHPTSKDAAVAINSIRSGATDQLPTNDQ